MVSVQSSQQPQSCEQKCRLLLNHYANDPPTLDIHPEVYRVVGIDNIKAASWLDLKGKVGSTDYIDFLSLEHFPFQTPFVKGVDRYGRSFVAFRFVRRDDPTDIHCLCLFQRYSDDPNKWVKGEYSEGHGSMMFHFQADRYSEATENETIRLCIKGEDSEWMLLKD